MKSRNKNILKKFKKCAYLKNETGIGVFAAQTASKVIDESLNKKYTSSIIICTSIQVVLLYDVLVT